MFGLLNLSIRRWTVDNISVEFVGLGRGLKR
jgi:hypothetical protein